jgi:hypothetical protein
MGKFDGAMIYFGGWIWVCGEKIVDVKKRMELCVCVIFLGGNILPSLLCYFQIAVVESSLQFCTYLFFICVCNIILPRNNLELLRGYIYHIII